MAARAAARAAGGQRRRAAARRRRPLPRRPVLRPAELGGLDGRDVEVDLDLVADQHVAAAQRLVEGHPEVRALDLARDLDGEALVAPGVLLDALQLGVEGDGPRDAVDRELAG